MATPSGAAVHRVTKSQTWLRGYHFDFSPWPIYFHKTQEARLNFGILGLVEFCCGMWWPCPSPISSTTGPAQKPEGLFTLHHSLAHLSTFWPHKELPFSHPSNTWAGGPRRPVQGVRSGPGIVYPGKPKMLGCRSVASRGYHKLWIMSHWHQWFLAPGATEIKCHFIMSPRGYILSDWHSCNVALTPGGWGSSNQVSPQWSYHLPPFLTVLLGRTSLKG